MTIHNENWRERVKNVTPTNICPKCNKEAPFGAVFFVGVEGMVQECRDCRKDEREEKLREMMRQEQEMMRDIYGFDNGVAWERERIIKLLETNKAWCNADSYTDQSCDCPWHLAIALIKGENK